MIEIKQHHGLTVTIRTGIDMLTPSEEYCAYEITIESDAPTVVIRGCHDMTPDFVDLRSDGGA